jgi:hypothetical protein
VLANWTPLRYHKPAINRQRVSGDEGSRIRTQPDDSCGDLIPADWWNDRAWPAIVKAFGGDETAALKLLLSDEGCQA